MRARFQNLSALGAVLFLGVSFSATAAPGLRLLAPRSGDLVASRLVVAASPAPVPPAGREPVTFSWAIEPSAAVASPIGPLSAQSRESWLQVSAADLERGVPLFTLGSGAVVRISPMVPGAAMPEVSSFLIGDSKGDPLPGAAAFESLVSAEQLTAAGMEVPAGTLAFRLRPELGARGLNLRLATGSVASGERYLVHVFDAGSTVALELATARGVYLDGQRLVATLEVGDARGRLPLSEVTAFITSPAGRAWPLAFSASPDGGWRTELTLDGREAATPGLWEIHTAAQGRADGQLFRRNARVAFAVSLPTARFSGAVEAASANTASGIVVQLGVEVATAGRYELRGLLFGTDASGSLKPAAVAHSAAWLEAGAGTVALRFDAKALAKGLEAPFEIRQLELRDQGRMSLLEHRARGLVIE